MNRKGAIMGALGAIILTLFMFFIMLNVLTGNYSIVASELDDQRCNIFVQGAGTTLYKAVDFFSNINVQCKKDRISISEDDKETVFREVADSMYRCWNRYGSGEHDFMSNVDTEGEWCYTCAKIDFEENAVFGLSLSQQEQEIFEYKEFIRWTRENSPEDSEDSYYDSMRLLYTDMNDQDLVEINQIMRDFELTVEEIQEEPEMRALVAHTSDEYQDLIDLRTKKINTAEDIYVVYKYNRADDGAVVEVMSAMAVSFGTAIVVDIGVGLVTGGAGFAKLVATGAKNTAKLLKLGRVIEAVKKIGKAKKFSKTYTISEDAVDSLTRSVRATEGIEEVASTGTTVASTGLTSRQITTGLSSLAAGGITFSEFDLSLNHLQYVDIMPQSQYLRECGLEPRMPEE